MSTLWQHKNYLLQIPYLVATNIYEYDIKKANINILFYKGIIDKKEYDRLYNLPRMQRQVEIGYMIKYNPDIDKILSDGICEMKKRFFEANNIDDSNVLSIKNDAVFLMKHKANITKFDNVEFVLKNNYTSYYKLGNLEVYFRSDRITGQMYFDVKGINDNTLNLHQDYMCTWLAQLMYTIETGDIEAAIKDITQFFNSFINRELPIEYYRSFDSLSGYIIIANNKTYLLQYAEEKDKYAIDITVNINIIREMYGYCTQLYFSRNR